MKIIEQFFIKYGWKKTLFLVALLVILVVASNTEINLSFSNLLEADSNNSVKNDVNKKHAKEATKEDYKGFIVHNELSKDVFRNWANVWSLSKYKTMDEKFVHENIDKALEAYLLYKDLNMVFTWEVVYAYNLAQLYIIHADFHRDTSSLDKAMEMLKSATDLISTDPSELSQTDRDFIVERNIIEESKMIRINIHAFRFAITEETFHQKTARTKLDSIGGCKILVRKKVVHEDIYLGTGCENPFQIKEEGFEYIKREN